MNRFETTPLSPTRRPLLRDNVNEIENGVQDGVGLYDGDQKSPQHDNGTAYITTHRFIWVDSTKAIHLNLEIVVDVVLVEKRLTSSAKIILYLDQSRKSFVQVAFRNGGDKVFFDRLKTSLASAAWKKVPVETKPVVKQTEFDPSRAGVGGILQGLEESQKKTSQTIDEAFSDLNALMTKAGDLVSLAERITKKLEKEGTEDENNLMRSYMMELGISSPVTKESAGSSFHIELSKQLADFLILLLRKQGGMITLPDLYCFFNRARGTALVSPEDLYRACSLFEKLKLPLKLRKLPSGVLLVQEESYSDDEFCSRIKKYVERRPITALDLAKLDRISVLIAQEQLNLAEEKGYVCRDETIQGVRYFENMIISFKMQ